MKYVYLFVTVFFLAFSINAQNLHNDNNAASELNEGNSTSGWTGLAQIFSDETNPQNGTFSITAVSTETNGRTLDYNFDAIIGEQYVIRIWAKVGTQTSAASPAFAVWSGVSGFATTPIVGTNWTEYVFNVTATSINPRIRVYTSNYPFRFDQGNTIHIDNVSILPLDTESPSIPTGLIASNTAETSTDLSWVESTDNTGVTNYEVFQDGVSIGLTAGSIAYTVTGLSASTSYNFTVTALDAANNRSVVSSPVSVLTQDEIDYTSINSNSFLVDWSAKDLFVDGNIGVGTKNTHGYRLAVVGNIVAEEIKVALQVNWPDFVFEKNYRLPTLKEVEEHIKDKGYLINIPSATKVKQDGIKLGEMNAMLLQKIEELTLYTIAQEKKINLLEKENNKVSVLQNRLLEIEKILEKIK